MQSSPGRYSLIKHFSAESSAVKLTLFILRYLFIKALPVGMPACFELSRLRFPQCSLCNKLDEQALHLIGL
jgi:hypothetical protein